VELQSRYVEFQKLGLGVASITYDAPPLVKKFADERKIEFPLLSDQDHTIVGRYGILNRQFQPGHRNYGIPHPGTFILSREGRVLARYFEEEFQYRNTAASIALKIGQPVPGAGAPTRQATPHADVAAFLTDSSVAPGHRFSIVLDIAPKPGIGIIAPGQHTYRVVALNLEASENLRTYALTYPRSTDFIVAPDGSQVAAYTQALRLIQDVAVAVNNEMRALAKKPGATVTLKGTLEYQACTERMCNPLQQVPFSWTLALTPLG
jgi:hypothetical protein